ncbi:hypothetical protein BJ878DRAFT_480005 [Calycina marina]|uniref:Uncharacterized protein n=1 Tax=Calycina marina TaxID=1763456 RepID=A0A9P7Z2W8_9HELO|nr:hypothetical protein BJ878DRAFT_480005 [Calycina marina]
MEAVALSNRSDLILAENDKLIARFDPTLAEGELNDPNDDSAKAKTLAAAFESASYDWKEPTCESRSRAEVVDWRRQQADAACEAKAKRVQILAEEDEIEREIREEGEANVFGILVEEGIDERQVKQEEAAKREEIASLEQEAAVQRDLERADTVKPEATASEEAGELGQRFEPVFLHGYNEVVYDMQVWTQCWADAYPNANDETKKQDPQYNAIKRLREYRDALYYRSEIFSTN